jgi:hypothetical protein
LQVETRDGRAEKSLWGNEEEEEKREKVFIY